MTLHDNDINQQRETRTQLIIKENMSRGEIARCESGLMNFMTREVFVEKIVRDKFNTMGIIF
jgi:hypothetical protein